MRKHYIHNDFLLNKKVSKHLFHNYAANLPIIDYHNHLNPEWLSENHSFKNIAKIWVTSDPYKHRAMRINGVPEEYITGKASEKEKFTAWMSTIPYTIGNPLHHWSHMEMKSIFGIDDILDKKNVDKIWIECNKQLQTDGYKTVDILQKFNTEKLCTSDDILDSLEHHKKASGAGKISVLPSLRGDSVLLPTIEQIKKLKVSLNINIDSLNEYKQAVYLRLNNFSNAGCRIADHSLDAGFSYAEVDEKRASSIFKSILKEKTLDLQGQQDLSNNILYFLGKEYASRKWKLLLHIGAHRYTSSRLRSLAGPAGGYAAIGSSVNLADLICLLDHLERNNSLPQTILFTLNPADNEVLSTLNGSFSEDGTPVKVQFGPAWWYNDHYEGIIKQLKDFASYSLLGRFIGMTTDSRSVLSFVRHEYFRRILCNQIGEWVESGFFPNDDSILKKLVQDISYYNSKNWLNN